MAVKLFKRVACLTTKLRCKLSRKSKHQDKVVAISEPVLVYRGRSPVAAMIAELDYTMSTVLDVPLLDESPTSPQEEHTTNNSAEAVAEPQIDSTTPAKTNASEEKMAEGLTGDETKEGVIVKGQSEEEKLSASDGEDARSEDLFTSSDDDSDSDSSNASQSSTSSSPPSSPPPSPNFELTSRFTADLASPAPSPVLISNHATGPARTTQTPRDHHTQSLFSQADQQLKPRSSRSEYRRSTLSSTLAPLPRSPPPKRSYTYSKSRPLMLHASALPSSSAAPRLPPISPSADLYPSSRSRRNTPTSPLDKAILAVSEKTEEEIEEHTPYNTAQDDRFIHLAALRSPRKVFDSRKGMEVDREDLRKELGKGLVKSKDVGAWEEEKRRPEGEARRR